jgi:hypothetical protein
MAAQGKACLARAAQKTQPNETEGENSDDRKAGTFAI